MSRPAARASENVVLGVVVIVATGLAMAFADALVKWLTGEFTLWQLYVLRSFVAIPILIGLLLLQRQPLTARMRPIGWAVLRSVLLMMMWVAFYAALPVVSLPVVAAAYYTGPLFITLFSACMIGEPVSVRRWIAILVGFAGVVVILRPASDGFSALALLPVLSAAFYALAAIVTRAKCREAHPLALSLILNLAFLAVGALASGTIAIWQPLGSDAAVHAFLFGRWTVLDGREWGLIVLLGVLIVGVSAGVAKAYQSGPSAIIATFDYAYLAFAAFWSWAMFSQAPDAATVVGMIMIAGAGMVALSDAGKCRRAPASDRSART